MHVCMWAWLHILTERNRTKQHSCVYPLGLPPLLRRVYVGSIVYDLGESDIMAIFQAFGQIRVGLTCDLWRMACGVWPVACDV